MSALHRALHMERVVIVTPSVYGPNNNGSTLFGVKARGATARGIAVVDDKTPDSDFDAMYRAGVRGARIISGVSGPVDPAAARPIYQAAMNRFKNHKWMIELYTNLGVISNIKDLVHSSPVPTVFDHFGGVQASLGLQQPGFADLLELLRSGSAYVKISGAYRASTKAPDYPDVVPFAKGIHRSQSGPRPVGHRLAASGRRTSRLQAERPHADVSHRRWPPAQPAPCLGARSGDPQEDPRRQSGAAVRVLRLR